MLFEPHVGRLAPRHQPEHLPADVVVPPRSISVYEAMVGAFRLFHERPLPAIGIGLVCLLAAAVTAAPAWIVGSLAQAAGTSGNPAVSMAGIPVPDWLLVIGGAALSFALLGTPLIVGAYAAAIRSAREGAPTCRGLLTGFRVYPASFTLGALAGVVSAVLGVIPFIGWAIGLFSATLIWAVLSTLADRRCKVADALSIGTTLVTGRMLPLVLLNLCAHLLGMAGLLLAGLGLVVTIPVMVLMLGIGFRDTAYAAGLPDPETDQPLV